MLTREFYQVDANALAPQLLGKRLVHQTAEGITAGMIVEVEAYVGSRDKGAHSYPNKRTPRTQIQFGPGGFAYVYGIYGLHFCFNVVANVAQEPEVVLIRALEPLEGIPLMEQRRNTTDRAVLCNGPGKLCSAMGITKAQYGYDLCNSTLSLEPYQQVDPSQILVSPRINIDYAQECRDYLWRYFLRDNSFVSPTPKRYRAQIAPYPGNFSASL